MPKFETTLVAYYLALADLSSEIIGIVIPDCPGCYAAGQTAEEAKGNASEALGKWLVNRLAAGVSAPKPRSMAELHADPSLCEDFTERAVVVLIQTGLAESQPSPELDGS